MKNCCIFANKNKLSFRAAGFTLIELLVVVAVIGLLAAIVLVSLNSTKAKSRDGKRIAEIKNLKTALEFYNNAQGQYVNAGNCTTGTWVVLNGATDAVSQALISLNLYAAGGAPADPMAPNQNYEYCYTASTKKYQLRYTLETNSNAGTQGVHIAEP